MPLRSVQTVQIVKLYKPLSEIRRENILSVLNEMQFTDRKVSLRSVQTVWIVRPFFQTVSVCLYWTTLKRAGDVALSKKWQTLKDVCFAFLCGIV